MPTVALVGPELFPIPPIRGGATEQFVEQVAHRLQRWQPVVIGVGDPDLPARERHGRVEYVRVPLTGWRRWLYRRHRTVFPFYDREVARVLRALKPELVHVHNRPLLARYLKLNLPGTPVILHLHNLYTVLGKRERPAPGVTIPVEACIACSRFVLDAEGHRLAAGAKARYVVYNGVDVKAFRPGWEQPAEAQALRHRHGLADEPTVLFVGKIRESKGVGLLLQAMESVWRELPRAVLVLVGGTEFGRGRLHRQTPFFQKLAARVAAAPGRVVQTGFISPTEVPRAYLMGDVCAAPSQIDEGLPLVILEAAASGLPLVSTRVGGIPEFVRDGETGLLLEQKDDAHELAAKLLLLLKDVEQRRRLGEAGRRRVEARFSWERIAADLEAVYDEVRQTQLQTAKP